MLLAKAKEAAERALSLDPRSPEARAVLAMIKMNFDWDLSGAEREIQEALRLNPSFAQAHQVLFRHPDADGPATKRSPRRDARWRSSDGADGRDHPGVRYYYANDRPRRSRSSRRRSSSRQDSRSRTGALRSAIACKAGSTTNRSAAQRRPALGNSAYMRAHLAYGYAVAGDRLRAEALRREIAAEATSRYVAPYHLALIAAGLGETAEAMKWLERAFTDRSGWLVFLAVEPEFDGMRQLPEFQQLLERVKKR